MSYLYQVTLNQGRSDNCYVYADNIANVQAFFKAVSTANITKIKKVVYSKTYKIGLDGVRAFSPQPFAKEIRLYPITENSQDILILRYVKEGLTDEFIHDKAKLYLKLNNEVIIDFNPLVRL